MGTYIEPRSCDGGPRETPPQAVGKAGASTNGNLGRSIVGARLPLRSNSMCRSDALERMIGKRVNTRSRTLRKLDAINATLANAFGNGRGSAMVSLRNTRR